MLSLVTHTYPSLNNKIIKIVYILFILLNFIANEFLFYRIKILLTPVGIEPLLSGYWGSYALLSMAAPSAISFY